MAHHAALLSRDGREFQIADSAAPIRNNRGQILGGHVRATKLIQTAVAGSPNGNQTILEVGVDPYAKQEHDRLQGDLVARRRKITEVKAIYLETGRAAGQPNTSSACSAPLHEVGNLEMAVKQLETDFTRQTAGSRRDRLFSGVRIGSTITAGRTTISTAAPSAKIVITLVR
jgi:hypothetical protein